MSYFYYVICQQEDAGEISTPIKISESTNLYSFFKRFNNVIIIHQCKTQKSAIELANTWNRCAFTNGKYIYSRLYPAAIVKY